MSTKLTEGLVALLGHFGILAPKCIIQIGNNVVTLYEPLDDEYKSSEAAPLDYIKRNITFSGRIRKAAASTW